MKTLKIIIGILIIMISGYGIISNTLHYFDIRKTEVVNFNDNSTAYKFTKNVLDDVKNNIDKIKNNSYSDEDNKKIEEYIDACYINLNNLSLFKDIDKKNFNDKEKYTLIDEISSTRCPAYIVASLNVISKYDNDIVNIKALMASTLLVNMKSLEPIKQRLINNYEYSSIIDVIGKSVKPAPYEMNMIFDNVRTQALALQYVTNYIVDREVQ
jgi:hypothetical protein